MTRLARSSAVTLATAYVLFGILALVMFAAPLWYAWQVVIEEGRTAILQDDAQRMTEVFRLRGASGLAAFIDQRVGLQIAGERILILVDPARHRLAGNLKNWPPNIDQNSGTVTTDVRLDGTPTQAELVIVTLPGEYRLLVGRDVARFIPVENRFWYGLCLATAVLVIAGFGGGWLIRQALLKRVDDMRRTVSAIMLGDLNHRLDMGHGGDELDTLSVTINGMLDQIQNLVEGITNVSNAIAHDLRTPLAELRSRLEEMIVIRPSAEETFVQIEAAVADVDRVISIFNALLRLAEIDAGIRRSGFVEVDVARVAAEVVDLYAPAVELAGRMLILDPAPPVLVTGDPILVAQALGNLIDNAVKHTLPHSRIWVRVRTCAEGVVEMSVADDGPGMAEAEKSLATQRFYRGDRSRGTPGVGLGLSVVEAVTRLHGGELALIDNDPGLRVSLTIPAAVSPPGGIITTPTTSQGPPVGRPLERGTDRIGGY